MFTVETESVFSVCCADVKEVFDLFDFWDGRDGMVDAAKIGDFLRCCNLNPTNAIVLANGGVEKMGWSEFSHLLAPPPPLFVVFPFYSSSSLFMLCLLFLHCFIHDFSYHRAEIII